mmetsp:Transcript_18156/g.45086  ORF Transcript_18156/g.45086 Transcript_18156/m.45086 type:complete len:157 (+) Transcript_18156:1-471(+)
MSKSADSVWRAENARAADLEAAAASDLKGEGSGAQHVVKSETPAAIVNTPEPSTGGSSTARGSRRQSKPSAGGGRPQRQQPRAAATEKSRSRRGPENDLSGALAHMDLAQLGAAEPQPLTPAQQQQQQRRRRCRERARAPRAAGRKRWSCRCCCCC